MHVSAWKIVVGILMIASGLLFAAQGWVFHDAPAALRIHRDLPPDADPAYVDLRVAALALAGLAWIVAGAGLATGRREWLPAAFVALLLVGGLHAAQLWMWGSSYLATSAVFGVFGVLALVYAVLCRSAWMSTKGMA